MFYKKEFEVVTFNVGKHVLQVHVVPSLVSLFDTIDLPVTAVAYLLTGASSFCSEQKLLFLQTRFKF